MLLRRLIPIAVFSTIVITALSPVAQATFPGHNGRIAYSVGSLDNISTMNPDGTHNTQLTHFPSGATVEFPRYSSSGKSIVFDAKDPTKLSSDYDIYKMKQDGSGQTQLTSDTSNFDDWGACFSPDGKQIAFISNRSGAFAVWVMNSNGSSPTQLTTLGNAEYTSWSPNGKWILFDATVGGHDEIYKVHPSGSGVAPLTTFPLQGSGADWSPNSKQITFSGSNTGGIQQIWIMNANGSSPHAITSAATNSDEPVWSPDGGHIAFDRYVSSTDHVWSIKKGGAGQKKLTGSGGGGEPGWQPT